jgi:hypothetical protein
MLAFAALNLMLLPNWNSLDSVRYAHSVLELLALIFFALAVIFEIWAHFCKDDRGKTLLAKIGLFFFTLMVIFEIFAYPYGQRIDTLSQQVISGLTGQLTTVKKNVDDFSKTGMSGLEELKAAIARITRNNSQTQTSLSNKQACDNAATLAGELRAFRSIYDLQQKTLLLSEHPANKQEINALINHQIGKLEQQHETEFRNRFWNDAKHLRDAMFKKLSPQEQGRLVGNNGMAWGILTSGVLTDQNGEEYVANFFDETAKSLCGAND